MQTLKAMKNIRFFLIIAIISLTQPTISAQGPSSYFESLRRPEMRNNVDIDTITVHGITYERFLTKDNRQTYRTCHLANPDNVLWDENLSRKDGKPLERDESSYGHGTLDMDALRKALSDVFTAEDNKRLGEERDDIWIALIFSTDDGRVLEVGFTMSASKVLREIPIEKFALLEHKIKKTVTTDLSNAPELKELKFVETVTAVYFPFQRSYIDTDAKRNDDDLSRIPKGALLQ